MVELRVTNIKPEFSLKFAVDTIVDLNARLHLLNVQVHLMFKNNGIDNKGHLLQNQELELSPKFMAAEERAHEVSTKANHTVKSLERKVRLLSEGLVSSKKDRRVAETGRDEFDAKTKENTSKHETVGVKDYIFEVEAIEKETESCPENF